MGIKGEAEGLALDLLKRAETLVREAVVPRYTWRVCDILRSEEGISAGGIKLFGRDIYRHLEGCTRAVFLAATLTTSADGLIRRAQAEDMAFALAADSVCSAAIEQVCDRAQEEILQRLGAVYSTWRFSPGYGDFPLEIQAQFLRALNAQRGIGLTCTEEFLLNPTKSVTAVIGISEIPVSKGERGCAICSMREQCGMRKNGGCRRK